jgi:hypothetical protein
MLEASPEIDGHGVHPSHSPETMAMVLRTIKAMEQRMIHTIEVHPLHLHGLVSIHMRRWNMDVTINRQSWSAWTRMPRLVR